MQIVDARRFSSSFDLYNNFTSAKVGGACSHLGCIGPKVGGALAPLALWLPRPWFSIRAISFLRTPAMQARASHDKRVRPSLRQSVKHVHVTKRKHLAKKREWYKTWNGWEWYKTRWNFIPISVFAIYAIAVV